MKLNRQQIQERAMQVLESSPQSIRWTELLRRVAENAPETSGSSIEGHISHLLASKSDEIVKVARGTYQLAKYVDKSDAIVQTAEVISMPIKSGVSGPVALDEQDFYASFAAWLVDNDEATFAAALGGNRLGSKWETPDVIGVLKPRAQDIFKFEPQIVTAEIKTNSKETVVAFGQAVAYRLFSHRSYIVVPQLTTSDDMSRLTSLCGIHGVGLVTFLLDKELPNYAVVVRPVNAAPDVFYVNNTLERLKNSEPALLNKLF